MMPELMVGGLVLPALVLGGWGFVVPRLLAIILPEGVGPLVLNAFLSTVVLWSSSAAFFAILYLWQGVPTADLFAAGYGAVIGAFGRLGLISGLIWAPVMLLSLAGLPRKWVNETW